MTGDNSGCCWAPKPHYKANEEDQIKETGLEVCALESCIDAMQPCVCGGLGGALLWMNITKASCAGGGEGI